MKNPDHAIAPGLEVSALVEYYTTRAEDAQDRVILVADNDVVEIPLMALVTCAFSRYLFVSDTHKSPRLIYAAQFTELIFLSSQ